MSEYRYVKTLEEALKFHTTDKVEFNCINCGQCTVQSIVRIKTNNKLLCTKCVSGISKKKFLENKKILTQEEYLMSKSFKHIINLSEINQIHGNKFITFNCVKCGVLAGNDLSRIRKKGLLLCGDCMKKYTNLKRFGYESAAQRPEARTFFSKYNKDHKDEINKARRLAIQNKYGVDNIMQVEEIKNKCLNSNRENHGGILSQQTDEGRKKQSERMLAHPEIHVKSFETNKNNHGGIHNLALSENREKLYNYQREHKNSIDETRQKTNLLKFGKTNYMCFGEPEYIELMVERYLDELPYSRKTELLNSDFSTVSYALWNDISDYKKMIINSIIENHDLKIKEDPDTISYAKACSLLRSKHPEWLEKTITTFMNKYNISHPVAKPVCIDGIMFDSDWEVYVYLYYRDKESAIIREPKPPLIYYDSEGDSHKYYPDFMIDGKYVEVKGSQFFKDQDPNKEMIFPYNKCKWDKEKLDKEMDIARCKGEFIKKNTYLISKHNIKLYKDYFFQNYDYNWLQSMRFNNLLQYSLSRFTFIPIYCNSLNNGRGITPFDCNSKSQYADITGPGLTPFDIKL